MQNIQCASAQLRRLRRAICMALSNMPRQRLLCSALYSNNLADIFHRLQFGNSGPAVKLKEEHIDA